MAGRENKMVPVVSLATPSATPQMPVNTSRISLFIQNTGGVAGLVRYGEPSQGTGFDFAFTAGEKLLWDQADTCPQEAIFFSGATTWAVLEGTRT